MSTRKDGLSLSAVNRTVRHVLHAYGVDVVGGNRRVLHLRRRDGAADAATAADRCGCQLGHTLALHGFAIRTRDGVQLVDLLQCDDDARSTDLAEQVAARIEHEARQDWRDREAAGERPPGRSASEYATDQSNEAYRWAVHETAPRLRNWLTSSSSPADATVA
jgi:hypothetical protein